MLLLFSEYCLQLLKSFCLCAIFWAQKKPLGYCGWESGVDDRLAFRRRDAFWLKISGLASRMNINLALGMPFLRHSDTEAGWTSQSFAVSLVPPKASMIWLSVRLVVMQPFLGIPENLSSTFRPA